MWGREAEIDALWRRLEVDSVLLTAPRRHGKSSVMYRLKDNPQPGWEVVLVDVMAVESAAEFLPEDDGYRFLDGLLAAWWKRNAASRGRR